MFRAGLLSLCLFLTFAGLATSAPLLKRPYSFTARYNEHDVDLTARSFVKSFDRELDFEGFDLPKRNAISIFDRDSGIENREYLNRVYDLSMHRERELDDLQVQYGKRDDPEPHTLHRRNIFTKIRNAFRHAFHKIGEGFKKFGHIVKKGFQKAGHAIKTGFQKFGQKVKQGFKKVGVVLKKGFQKVGHFIKTTGAKIAKFGLKVVSAIASVASKVVKFIPGIGEGLSIAVKGLAKGADIASDKIHAHLGKKLDKAMHGMDYVISPVGTAAKDAGKSIGAGGVVADLLT